MSRILDANLVFAGKEPKFQGEVTQTELMVALSWYAQNKTKKDALKYATDFLKKKHKVDAASALKKRPSTFGYLCRLVTNGAVLSAKDQVKFDEEVELVKTDTQNKKVEITIEEDTTLIPSIQDRIRERASNCIAELEGLLDDLVVSKFTINAQPYGVMDTLSIKSVHTRFIIDWAKSKRNEFDEVMNTEDKLLKEGYSNFKKTELKKMVSFFDQVILDCGKLVTQSAVNRKPRKRKEKTPEQLVSKVKHCPKYDDLGLTSVKLPDIIGSLQLWVYNTKTRKLGVYHAEDAGGLSVKGSSLTNFSEAKSVQKTLRKPETVLPDVVSGGKVMMRSVLTNVKSVESKLSGRLNEDVVLLRIMK